MKGKTRLDLYDKDGNLKQSVEDNNMLTAAISNLLNPDWIINKYNSNSSSIRPHTVYTPFLDNVIGGILIFNDNITENIDNILPDYDKFLGNAGGKFTGISKYRGNFNVNESGIIYDGSIKKGYKYVWDFATGTAVGTIKAVGLTSRSGGNAGLIKDDRDTTNSTVFMEYGKALTEEVTPMDVYDEFANALLNLETIATEYGSYVCNIDKNTILTVKNDQQNVQEASIKFYKIKVPTNINLFTNIKPSVAPTDLIIQEYIYNTTDYFAGNDGWLYNQYDNKVYGIAVRNESGVAKIRLDKLDLVTMVMGARENYECNVELELDGTLTNNTAIRIANYIYIHGFNISNNLYKYNITTGAIETIVLDIRCKYFSYFKENTILGTSKNGYEKWPLRFITTETNNIYKTNYQGQQAGRMINIQALNTSTYNKPIMTCRAGNTLKYLVYTTYLASINNLAVAVTKTEQDTLKITYELLL